MSGDSNALAISRAVFDVCGMRLLGVLNSNIMDTYCRFAGRREAILPCPETYVAGS